MYYGIDHVIGAGSSHSLVFVTTPIQKSSATRGKIINISNLLIGCADKNILVLLRTAIHRYIFSKMEPFLFFSSSFEDG